jgi:Zn-dependent M32 family carboxypeptidase
VNVLKKEKSKNIEECEKSVRRVVKKKKKKGKCVPSETQRGV